MKSQSVTISFDDNKSSGKIYVENNIIYLDFGITKQIIDFNDIKVIDKVENNSVNIVLSDNSMITLKFREYLVLYKMVEEFIEGKKHKEGKKCPECGEMNDEKSSICINCGFPFKKVGHIKSNINIKKIIIVLLLISIVVIVFLIKGSILNTSKKINIKLEKYIENKKYTDSTCFKVENGVIIKYDDSCPKDVVIPKQIDNKQITEIGKEAFYEKGITSVCFPDGLLIIGKGAFGRNKLTKVVLPNSVKKIYSDAFNSNKIKNLVLSDNLTLIGAWSFDGNYIEELVIPDSVKKINQEAFANNNLKKVIIGSKVSTIEYAAFGQYDWEIPYYGNEGGEQNKNLSLISNRTNKKFDWYDVLAYDSMANGPELWLKTGIVETKFGKIEIIK